MEESLLRVVLEELGYYDVSKFFSAIMKPEESMLTFEVTENVRKLLDELPDMLKDEVRRFLPEVVLQLAKHNPKWLLLSDSYRLLRFIVEHDIQLTQQELEALEGGDSEARSLAQLLRGYEQPTVAQKSLLDFLNYAIRSLTDVISMKVIMLAYENNVRVTNYLAVCNVSLVLLSEPPITTQDVLERLSRNAFGTAFAYVASLSVDWDTILPRLKRAYERVQKGAFTKDYKRETMNHLLCSAIIRNKLQEVLEFAPQLAERYDELKLWGLVDPVTEEMIRRMSKKGGEELWKKVC